MHATAKFDGKVDTPIRSANGFVNGNCLWNEFISGNARTLPTEDVDDIEKYVHWYVMTNAAEFDRPIIWKVQRDYLKSICQSGLSSTNSSDDEEEAKRPSKLKASSPSYQDDS